MHRGLADVRYSAVDGLAAVHLVHLEAVPWGVQPVFTEADGCRGARAISPEDAGIYLDSHVAS